MVEKNFTFVMLGICLILAKRKIKGKPMKKTLLFLIPTLFSGAVIAKGRDITLSFGYVNTHFSGVKDNINLMRDDVRKAGDAIKNSFGVPAVISLDDYSNLGGFFMRYRDEITDDWGVIVSIAYAARDYDGTAQANKNNGKDSITTLGTAKGSSVSFMVGPTYRFNEYVSLYGLIGGAYKKASYRLRSQEFKNNSLVSSSETDQSDNKTELAYGVGMQVNVYEGVTLDAGYERSGSGDWKTDAFIVGVGYKF
ncbi:MAG: Ail/Lom family outer membrane beta-barrel protein [Candidatus Arsenophonus phytopathogenicus]